MRYPKSGTATSVIGPATDVSTGGAYPGPPTLLSGGITSGRAFWLRGLSLAYDAATNASTGPINFYDAASGATATAAPALRLPGPSVSGLPILVTAVGVLTTTSIVTITVSSTVGDFLANRAVYNFGAPGIKFATGVAAMMDASGRIPPGHLVVWGYEE